MAGRRRHTDIRERRKWSALDNVGQGCMCREADSETGVEFIPYGTAQEPLDRRVWTRIGLNRVHHRPDVLADRSSDGIEVDGIRSLHALLLQKPIEVVDAARLSVKQVR